MPVNGHTKQPANYKVHVTPGQTLPTPSLFPSLREANTNCAFQLILKAGTEITEEVADRLFDAGCDDATPGTFCGTPYISFHREADNLESAIRSAVSDVQKAGCVVERLQIDHDSPLLSSGAE